MNAIGYDANTQKVWVVAQDAATCPTEFNGTALTVVALNDAQQAQLTAAQAQQSNGLTFDGTTVSASPYTPPTPPGEATASAGSGAGSGAVVAIYQPDPSMTTNVRGIVDVTVGTSPTADANGHYPMAVITFSADSPWRALNVAPLGAMIDRVNSNAIALGLVCSDALSTASFTILAEKAPTAGQTYRLSYALG